MGWGLPGLFIAHCRIGIKRPMSRQPLDSSYCFHTLHNKLARACSFLEDPLLNSEQRLRIIPAPYRVTMGKISGVLQALLLLIQNYQMFYSALSRIDASGHGTCNQILETIADYWVELFTNGTFSEQFPEKRRMYNFFIISNSWCFNWLHYLAEWGGSGMYWFSQKIRILELFVRQKYVGFSQFCNWSSCFPCSASFPFLSSLCLLCRLF